MREYELDRLPIFQNGSFVSDILYKDLIEFVNQKERGQNLYYHKVNFDLGSALILINENHKRKQRVNLTMAMAAVVTITVMGMAWLFFKSDPTMPAAEPLQVVAGSNKATLTLPDGKEIILSNAKNGILLTEPSFEVIKAADGQLQYTIHPSSSSAANGYHVITTPKGGQYQVSLSDGTKVWLNAGSTLKFPASFANAKNRSISLTGEAYFEVAKDQLHPFVVSTKGQQIAVLGTHFNVSAYPDDSSVKTMLLEGSVRIDPSNEALNSTLLKPNQQAILTGGRIAIKDVDAEEAIDWKNGEFIFRKEPLAQVMRKIARWYDVEVVYEDAELGKTPIGGFFSKTEQFAEVLKVLELTAKVQFKVEGRQVTVTK